MNKNKNWLAPLAAALLACVASTAANAEQVTVAIRANVTSVDDYSGILSGRIQVGDVIDGYYVYDTATPDSNSSTIGGTYWHHSTQHGMALEINGLLFASDPGDVQFVVEVQDNVVGKKYEQYALKSNKNIFDMSAPDGDSPVTNTLSWNLAAFTGAALSSDQLPGSSPVLADWLSNSLSIYSSGNGRKYLVTAKVTSAEVVPSVEGDERVCVSPNTTGLNCRP